MNSDYSSYWLELMGVPFRQDYALAGALRTRFLQTGAGRPQAVIFLHGFLSHADIFIRNLAAHGEHFNTFAIDLIGMGFSDKPDYPYHSPVVARQVRDFMDAMQIERATIAGTSFGSRVAARFALDYPERLERLSLISPAGLHFNPQRSARLIDLHFVAHDESTWDGARTAMEHIVNPEVLFNDAIAARRRVYSQPGIRDTDHHLKVHHLPETAALSLVDAAAYRAIRVPTLIVQGTMDSFADNGLAQELHGLIPDSRVVELSGSRHAPYFEQAQRFNALHLQFLRGEPISA